MVECLAFSIRYGNTIVYVANDPGTIFRQLCETAPDFCETHLRRYSVRSIILFLCLLLMSFFIISCDSIEDYFDDDDDGGTQGGSGEMATAATAAKETQTNQGANDKVFLDAFEDFSCSDNWTDRDGALGLSPHLGSGECSASFPGESGKYRISVKIQTEFDGRSPYEVTINGNVIKHGEYPLSSPLHCDCPKDDWRSVCPDKDVTVDCGTHTLKTGDTIGFWGDEVYPCGDHGSYAKWHGMTFTPVH
jgi:hypothetical protein